MTSMRNSLAELINEHAVKKGMFKLSSGGTSDVLVDLSQVLRTEEGFRMLRKCFAEIGDIVYPIDAVPFQAVGGPLSGSDPVAAALVCSWFIPHWFGVRKEAKDRGHDEGAITGPLMPGWRVLLVEDVCTTGGNLLRVAQSLIDFGCEIGHVLTVVDRGGLARVQETLKVPATSLFTLNGDRVVLTPLVDTRTRS